MSDSERKPAEASACTAKRVSVRRLIKLVRQRQCLWERADPSYRHRHLKDEAWRQICTALKPDYDDMNDFHKMKFVNDITRRWYNIRDAYVKSKRTGYRNRPYVYSDLLTFIDHIYFGKNAVARRQSRYIDTGNPEDFISENTMTEDITAVDVAAKEDDESELSNGPLNEVYIESEEPQDKSKFGHESKLFNDDYSNIVCVLANLIKKEEDDDRAFFKSITPAVKKLSEEKKFKFRIRVMKLLEELRKSDKNSFLVNVEKELQDDSDVD